MSDAPGSKRTGGQSSNNPNQYEFDGQSYVYMDKTTNVKYKFDQVKNQWVPQDQSQNELGKDDEKKEEASGPAVAAPGGIYGFENDTHTYTDPNDGSVYIWDREKNAWFPKVDEDFMARYQMSYGFTNSNAIEPSQKIPENPVQPLLQPKLTKEQKKAEAKRKAQEPPTWFEIDEAHNTAIYVSGLPMDITLEELTELFNKCGLIARDEKGKDKIKLYRDSAGELKGDALCTYIKLKLRISTSGNA
ncbi:hypothetical protein HZH68_011515 [Vespula germanica]|uniref:RRM domain-containing protein n=1 Tax=Vespula germanica TaxID=30212 RepID=A0A834JPN3_VESGE|nr:hypothetical protein HZH68_011515 [Vespula germanica]